MIAILLIGWCGLLILSYKIAEIVLKKSGSL